MSSTKFLQSQNNKSFIIASSKDNNMKFSVSIVTDTQTEEVAKHIGVIHSRFEPICCYMGFTEEDQTQMVKDVMVINKGLSIVARELDTNKIVASLICEDVMSESNVQDIIDEMKEQDQNDPQVKRFLKLINCFDFYTKLDTNQKVYFQAKKNQQHFHIPFMSCEPKFTGHGLMTQLVKYMIFEHPIVKNAQSIRVECTNVGSMIPCLKNGFISEIVSEYKDYLDCETNENTFADLPIFLENSNLPKTTQMEIMMYYKTKGQIIQC